MCISLDRNIIKAEMCSYLGMLMGLAAQMLHARVVSMCRLPADRAVWNIGAGGQL